MKVPITLPVVSRGCGQDAQRHPDQRRRHRRYATDINDDDRLFAKDRDHEEQRPAQLPARKGGDRQNPRPRRHQHKALYRQQQGQLDHVLDRFDLVKVVDVDGF